MKFTAVYSVLAILLLDVAVGIHGNAHAAASDLFSVTPQQVASTIEEYFQKAADDIANCRVRDARQELSIIGFKIDKYKKIIPPDVKKGYETRMTEMNGSIKREVDSLVKVNIAIVKASGRIQGNEFRQNLASQKGLSEAELAPVDDAIMESPAAEEEYTPKPHRRSEPEPVLPKTVTPAPKPEPPAAPAPPPAPPVQPAVSTQPARAPEIKKPETVPPKRDSVGPGPAVELSGQSAQNAQSERKVPDEEFNKNSMRAVTMAAKTRALLDEGKTEEAMTVFQIYEGNMERYLDARAFADLKALVEAADSRDRNERTRAAEQARTIERLLDQDKASEASAELNRDRDALLRYMEKQEFKNLESRVSRAAAEFKERQAAAYAVEREIRSRLTAGKIDDAYVMFEKTRSDLDRGLPNEEMANLTREVAAAYDALQDKMKLAVLSERDIRSLIAAGKGSAALSRFEENRAILQKYLNAKAFSSLEGDADRANREFLKRKERAASTLFRIDSLVALGKIQEAHDLFDETKTKVRRDISDDLRFLETKERLTKAYDSFIAEKDQADRTERKIRYLISRKEGRTAEGLFEQEKARLRKYLEPAGFDKLDRAVRRAKSEYESGYAAARSTVASLEELLAKNKIEQAYSAFERAEDDFDFYFSDDKAVAAVVKKVKDSYSALKERKKWASSTVREIRRSIEKSRGDLAYSRFQDSKPELAKYLEAAALSDLDTSVSRANRAFVAAKSRAEQKAAAIRGLVVQKKIDEAFASFDDAESELRFYLDPNVFTALKTVVEKFNEALQDRKREAMDIARTIGSLIAREHGDSAYAVFTMNAEFLAKHLDSKMYKSLSDKVTAAKADFAKNCRRAQTIAAGIKTLLDREKPEAAYSEFNDKQDTLDQYLDKVTVSRLETAVRVAYEFLLQQRKQARGTVSVLRRMIGQNQCVEAHAEFEGRKKDLARFLPDDEFTDIKARVATAYDKSVVGRRDAKAATEKIWKLLAEDKIQDAYRLFQDSRSVLELYSSKSVYSNLRSEVITAHDELEGKQKQAKEYAKKLRQFASGNKIWDAYKGFNTNRRALREYLDPDAFSDLEKTVVEAYEKAKAKSKGGRKK
jgi:hypothetical protein